MPCSAAASGGAIADTGRSSARSSGIFAATDAAQTSAPAASCSHDAPWVTHSQGGVTTIAMSAASESQRDLALAAHDVIDLEGVENVVVEHRRVDPPEHDRHIGTIAPHLADHRHRGRPRHRGGGNADQAAVRQIGRIFVDAMGSVGDQVRNDGLVTGSRNTACNR